MIEIGINKVSKSYGFNKILDNISFEVKTGEKIALIGENGCGKTTLLNIISATETLDSGIISIAKNSNIGYLKQNMDIKDDIIVKDLLYENIKEIIDLEDKMHLLEQEMINTSNLDKVLKKYGNLQDRYQLLNGYKVRSEIDKIINGFKIEKLIDKNYQELSGGEKRIVQLASMMIKNPNILLLDEPTNHLDIDTLKWFEEYLNNYSGTILFISHDRYFIDKVATKTILIENGHEYIFNGNYTYYLIENEKRIENEFKEYKDQQKLIEALKKKIKQLEEFGRLAYPGGEPFFKRAENIRKRLERIEIIKKPIIKKEIPLNFEISGRSGNEVLKIDNLELKINNKNLINNINLNIYYQDRVCIMGKNGCGKSTLIKQIINSKNDKIKIGTNIKIGYIPQIIEFNDNITILDYAKKYYIGDETHLRSALNKFYFNQVSIFKRINKLSGGEKVRLKLFILIQENCNFLIMDEPTNHIDIFTKEILEEALLNYEGTLLFISHDRYFINKIANKIYYIENNELKKGSI